MPLLAVAVLLAAGVLADARSSTGVTRVPLPTESPEQPAAGASAATAGPSADIVAPRLVQQLALPAWVDTVLSGLCLAFVLVVVGMLVWYVIRDRLRVRTAPLLAGDGPIELPATHTQEVVAALDEGLVGLGDQDSD